MVERAVDNRLVPGSIPGLTTTKGGDKLDENDGKLRVSEDPVTGRAVVETPEGFEMLAERFFRRCNWAKRKKKRQRMARMMAIAENRRQKGEPPPLAEEYADAMGVSPITVYRYSAEIWEKEGVRILKRGPRKSKLIDQIAHIQAMLDAGITKENVAKACDVSVRTLYRVLAKTKEKKHEPSQESPQNDAD